MKKYYFDPKYICLLLLFCFASIAAVDVQDDEKHNYDLAQIIQSIALIYTDDKLDPEVEKFINYEPEIIWEDNAYVYLWGMRTKEESPYKVGKEILEKLVEEDKLYNYEQHPLNLDFLDDYEQFDLPESNLLCKKHEKGCINKILKNKNIGLFLSEYEFYKFRYLIFLKFYHFNQIADRRLESPIPSFMAITYAQKIFHISVLHEIKNTPKAITTEQLIDELNHLKNLLKQSDTLLSKMVILAMINENVEFINYLYQNNLTNFNVVNSQTIFRPLKQSEKSLYNAMYEEHTKGMKMLFDWTSDYKALTRKAKNLFGDGLMKVYHFLVSKPNLTVNTQYNQIVKQLLIITKLPPKLFYKEYEKFENKVTHDKIRNYIGHLLMSYPMPDYLIYQARIFDVDMKIQLLRLIIQSESIYNLNISDEFLSSYDNTEPFVKDGKICYSGVTELFPENRCLLIYNTP